MKTDLVEIFQTIRASVQPYATMGYTVHENSETGYDLYSEKNIESNGVKTTERFFVGIYINGEGIEVKLNTEDFNTKYDHLVDFGKERLGMKVNQLDNEKLKEITIFVEIINNNFKEKGWI